MRKKIFTFLLALAASVGLSWATTIDLATITTDYVIPDGATLTGTLQNNVVLTVADNATITLSNVDINWDKTWTGGEHAGITCDNATIILAECTTNKIRGFLDGNPGVRVRPGKTLTIQGTGTLYAATNGGAAAIGGGYGAQGSSARDGGNIVILNGTIFATGGNLGAGIGSGGRAKVGNITIQGGIITATGGGSAAGIGCGQTKQSDWKAQCGNITISNGVKYLKATKGSGAAHSIGKGNNDGIAVCGTVTINGTTGAISSSPYTYSPAADNVKNLINAIGTVEYTTESKDKIDAARAAYDALADYSCDVDAVNALKDAVSNYSTLTDAEAAYDALIPAPSVTAARFVYNYDCQRYPAFPKVNNACSLSGFKDPYEGYKGYRNGNIALGPWKLEFVAYYTPSNNYDCASQVNSAVYQYYSNLSDEEREAIKLGVPIFRLLQYNLTAREYQHAAYGIVCAYASEGNIEDHGALFVSSNGMGCFLSGHQHTSSFNLTCENDLTTGLAALVDAASAPSDPYYDVVWPVIVSIDAIGTVELSEHCKYYIEGSRAAYNALTDEQKAQVTNYSTLTDAEAEWADLVAVAQPYADAVIALINAIPDPVVYTQDCKDKIDAAQAAYDALTDGQKILVTNADELPQAIIDYINAAPSINIVFEANNNTKKYEDVTLPQAFTSGGDASEMVTMLKELYNLDGEYDIWYCNSNNEAVTFTKGYNPTWVVAPFMGTVRVAGAIENQSNWSTVNFTVDITLELPPLAPASTPNSITINGTPAVGDNSISLTYYFDPANVPGITGYAPTLKVKCVEDGKYDEIWLSLSEISSGTTTITLDELGSFQAGKSYEVCFAYYNGSWVDEMFQSFSFSTPAPTAVEIGDPNNASEVETFLTTYDGQTIDELVIDRPVYNNMYNTLCLPFNMDATQIAASSLNGVIIREFTGASVVGQTLELAVSDPVNAVVAGRPYFVQYSAASQLDDLHFEGVTINNAVLDDEAITFDGVTFKGTFTPFVMPNGLNFQGGYLFLGQNNQLYWPNTTNPLKPFRAYFYVDVESSTPGNAPKYRGMPARIVEGKNVATGIENAQSANQSTKVIVNGQLIIIKNDVRYNAQGQIVK